MFEKTCFGHLLQLQVRFCGAIVHSLLLREVDCSGMEDESKMMFLVEGNTLQFTKREFGLVIGLPVYKRPLFLPTEHRLSDLYFDDANHIDMHAMVGALDKCQDDVDRVKLALVYMLEYFLLGKNKQETYVNPIHLQIVDDLDLFNLYHWGRLVSFERTICSLRNALKEFREGGKKATQEAKAVAHYALLGCPYAFQVWAYESIYDLGATFAIKTGLKDCPRILQWTSVKPPKYNTLNTSVFGRKRVGEGGTYCT
ncbi:protein of unknown function DUF1985 [Macleaya cordata]|uniref:DUF1985 domain-containing protein n=1 Tax=Macleaya cordata TaxID=56857 RepID=A0A200PSM4_MACCD|nr:protein of unknown function DUF1985 [Macleaya cordata]